MRVMVIGSGGYMGRHLMTGLSSTDVDAIGASSSDGTGIDPQSGLLSASFGIPGDVAVVVYMAQSPRYREVPENAVHVMAVNTLSAVRAATLARAAGVQRFIYVSTGTVYAPSFDPIPEAAPVRRDNWYVLSKLHAEEALALFRHDMEIVLLRPFGVYGPGQHGRLMPNLINAVKVGQPVTLQPKVGVPDDTDGLRISLCYVDDATRILLQLVEQGGPSCLNLAGPETLSIRFMAKTIGDLLGKSPLFEVSTSPRVSDLIADTRNLIDSLDAPTFTPFSEGIQRTVDSSLIL